MSKATQMGLQTTAIIAVLLIWWGASAADFMNPSIVPPVDQAAAALVTLLGRPEFWPAVGATVSDSLLGLAIATVLGIGLGLIIGMQPKIEVTTRFLVDFGRSFPVVALLPILLLILGATTQMKVTAIAIACFFPILLQAIYGSRRLESTISDTVRGYRIPTLLKFFKVILPAATPFIFTGFRIASIVSILVAVGTEVVSPTEGMGRQLALSRGYGEATIAFAYAVYAGLLGVSASLFVDLIEWKLLGWHLRSATE